MSFAPRSVPLLDVIDSGQQEDGPARMQQSDSASRMLLETKIKTETKSGKYVSLSLVSLVKMWKYRLIFRISHSS